MAMSENVTTEEDYEGKVKSKEGVDGEKRSPVPNAQEIGQIYAKGVFYAFAFP